MIVPNQSDVLVPCLPLVGGCALSFATNLLYNGSRDGAVVWALASHQMCYPGFDSWTCRHMWMSTLAPFIYFLFTLCLPFLLFLNLISIHMFRAYTKQPTTSAGVTIISMIITTCHHFYYSLRRLINNIDSYNKYNKNGLQFRGNYTNRGDLWLTTWWNEYKATSHCNFILILPNV